MPVALIVHGGAGDIDQSEHAARLNALRDAVAAGLPMLNRGGSALDAVEAATRMMESFPLLNAGRGAAPTSDGTIELDALIADGKTGRFGAVAAVQHIEHPVSLARLVMDNSPHHFMVGSGAEQFGAKNGLQLIDNDALKVEKDEKARITNNGGDTVGAVALDLNGNIAVAVSTGGVRGQLPGRVGDSPVIGAGGYADNLLGGACTTGVGEGIMRALLAYRAIQALEATKDVQHSVQQALDIFTKRFEGSGGLIMIDTQGRIGIGHNTSVMPVAYTYGDQIFAQIAGQGPQK